LSTKKGRIHPLNKEQIRPDGRQSKLPAPLRYSAFRQSQKAVQRYFNYSNLMVKMQEKYRLKCA